MSEKIVDYLELIGRVTEEDRAQRDIESILPEPAGEQVVDYMAVSKAWKEERGWMDDGEKD